MCTRCEGYGKVNRITGIEKCVVCNGMGTVPLPPQRQTLGQRIAQMRDDVRITIVVGSTGNKYQVEENVRTGLWTCTCKAFEYIAGPCKHIRQVKEDRKDATARGDHQRDFSEGEQHAGE
jgi:hypothetical protein